MRILITGTGGYTGLSKVNPIEVEARLVGECAEVKGSELLAAGASMFVAEKEYCFAPYTFAVVKTEGVR